MERKITGGCLCGKVRYEIRGEPFVGGHCQCLDCRKSSGTGHCSHLGVKADDFSLSGKTTQYDKPADSGNVVSRHFCPVCGAAVHSTNSGMQGMVFVRASSLDDPEVFKPQMVVYASRAPSWDALDPALPAFDEMPPKEEMP